jgi:hypothetical protein
MKVHAGERTVQHGLALLLLCPFPTFAGTSYLVTNKSLSPRNSSHSVAQYYVQDGAVRAGGLDQHSVYVFKDDKVYVMDNSAKTIQVVTSALVAQAADKMDERIASIKDSAAKLPPDKRAILDKMAADMQAVNDSRRLPVPRQYHLTERSDVVAGHACRIWEVFEWNAKHFEFCVAPAAAIAGGSEILRGMRLLSKYWQGSVFALGVKLGNAAWWPEIADLQGLPILIREFKDGSAVSETALTDIRGGVKDAAPLDLPTGYSRTEVAFIP